MAATFTRSGDSVGVSQSWGGGSFGSLRFLTIIVVLFLVGCTSVWERRSEEAHLALTQLRLDKEAVELQLESAETERKKELELLKSRLEEKIVAVESERETYDERAAKDTESSRAVWGSLLALAMAGLKALGPLAAKGATG
jgi:hypothetical protein